MLRNPAPAEPYVCRRFARGLRLEREPDVCRTGSLAIPGSRRRRMFVEFARNPRLQRSRMSVEHVPPRLRLQRSRILSTQILNRRESQEHPAPLGQLRSEGLSCYKHLAPLEPNLERYDLQGRLGRRSTSEIV